MHLLFAALLLISAGSSGSTWTNKEGSTIQASFVSLTEEHVYLNRDHRTYKVPLERLSEESLAFTIDLRNALSDLRTTRWQTKAYPEHVLQAILDSDPALLKGRTLRMSATAARLLGPGNAEGPAVEIQTETGLRTVIAPRETWDRQGTVKIVGSRAILIPDSSASTHPFQSLEALVGVGEPVVLPVTIREGSLVALDPPKRTVEKEAVVANPLQKLEPVQVQISQYRPQSQVLARAVSADRYSGGLGELESENDSHAPALEFPTSEPYTSIDSRTSEEPEAGTIGMARRTGITFNGKRQILLSDGRYVPEDSEEALAQFHPAGHDLNPDRTMATDAGAITADDALLEQSVRPDFKYTGITFNGKRQVKLADGRIVDEASLGLPSAAASHPQSLHSRDLSSPTPRNSVVVKDETGFRIKLSSGGFAPLYSPEGQAQLQWDRASKPNGIRHPITNPKFD